METGKATEASAPEKAAENKIDYSAEEIAAAAKRPSAAIWHTAACSAGTGRGLRAVLQAGRARLQNTLYREGTGSQTTLHNTQTTAPDSRHAAQNSQTSVPRRTSCAVQIILCAAHSISQTVPRSVRAIASSALRTARGISQTALRAVRATPHATLCITQGVSKTTLRIIRAIPQVTFYTAQNILRGMLCAAQAIPRAAKQIRRGLTRIPWKKVWIGTGCTLAGAVLLFSLIIWRLIAAAPEIDASSVAPAEAATWICDSEGNYRRKLAQSEANRDIVTLDAIPESLQEAIIAIEDARFYEHNGIDLRGIARAFRNGILNGSFSEGASTITQQLIKNSVFTDWTQESSFAERFARKVQEQYLALKLEKLLSKEEILEDYLNTINFGSGCYGVQAAARRYLGKDVSELTLAESAMLAAIPQNPSGYSPINYPEANRSRQQLVLLYMEEQGYISAAEREAALEEDVYASVQAYNETYEADSVYSYYEDALIDQVAEVLTSELGYSSEQAYRAIYSGGLRIWSAQDETLQAICDEEFQNEANFPEDVQYGVDYALSIKNADGTVTSYGTADLQSFVRENLDADFNLMCETREEGQSYADAFRAYALAKASAEADSASSAEVDGDAADNDRAGTESTPADTAGKPTVLSERLTLSPQPQASLVLIEQETGFVRAIVGGRGEKTASLTLNRATDSLRQPGSTFKILTAYAPALDLCGQTLATLYENEPYAYSDGTTVSNWDITDYTGTVTIREAITRSINVVAVRCLTEITPRLGFESAKRFGISTLIDGQESEDGSSDVIQPLALGGITQGVSNLELCAAYASIANGGLYGQPLFFTKILDRDGNVLIDCSGRSASKAEQTASVSAAATADAQTIALLSANPAVSADAQTTALLSANPAVSADAQTTALLSASPAVSADAQTTALLSADAADAGANAQNNSAASFGSFTRILQESTAFLLTSAMQDVVSSPDGTAYGVSAAGQPVAGKTGTTSNYKDIWFVGYTPYYTCCVWGGYDNNQNLPGGTAHSYSKTLWSAVMNRIHASLPAAEFSQPDDVEAVLLCSDSHALAREGVCPSVCTEYFAAGTAPEETCTLHEPSPKTVSDSGAAGGSETVLIYPELLEQLQQETPAETEISAESQEESAEIQKETPEDAGETAASSESDAGTAGTQNNAPESTGGISGSSESGGGIAGSLNGTTNPESAGEISGSQSEIPEDADGVPDSQSEAENPAESSSESQEGSSESADETSSLDDLLGRLSGEGFALY